MPVQKAAEDMKYLLDRGYNRDTSLNLAVNRYHLDMQERNYLRRYVFSENEIRVHKSKLIPVREINGEKIVVDGFNVLITVDAVLKEKNLVESMDCILRDTSMVFSNYRFDSDTKKALDRLMTLFTEYSPENVFFVFDSQISRSGELAAYVREEMNDAGISGDASTAKSADRKIIGLNHITASSDSHIIESVDWIVDLSKAIKH
ncbi:MAG: hypothetical protein B6U72_02155 [Candidatus Altiarchaeales archaeon ex4484_2]|nr:MAG: hypothetical protein B6U72_02155 [Candidatus Altiarchaeales archaeon ex4484_2]